jgi:hypothetical protein
MSLPWTLRRLVIVTLVVGLLFGGLYVNVSSHVLSYSTTPQPHASGASAQLLACGGGVDTHC